MISIQRYTYIFIYSQIHIHRRTLLLKVRTVLLTSLFRSSTRGERHNSYYADHTI